MQKKDWEAYVKQHLYRSHDGFHEMPYLSNSPLVMTESMIFLPHSVHNEKQQLIRSETAYANAAMHYCEIEAGLWLLASEMTVKKNVVLRALYADDVPEKYYFLSFAVFEYYYPVNNTFSEFAKLISTTCTFYRPGTEVSSFFYEHTAGRVFNLVFTKEWAQKNLSSRNRQEKEQMKKFLNNETGFINWIDIVPDAAVLSGKLYSYFEKDKGAPVDPEFLKKQMIKIIADFFDRACEEKRIDNYTALHNPDYFNVATAEKYILNNLHEPFIGVESLAKKVNVSATKLKKIFKTVFGFSMLQYHKEKNMLLARQLVNRSDMHIKNIALITGYESAAKFTATFKKRFGVLPSAIREQSDRSCG